MLEFGIGIFGVILNSSTKQVHNFVDLFCRNVGNWKVCRDCGPCFAAFDQLRIQKHFVHVKIYCHIEVEMTLEAFRQQYCSDEVAGHHCPLYLVFIISLLISCDSAFHVSVVTSTL